MSGYSLDLRQRVLAAVARGMPRQEIVVTFALSRGVAAAIILTGPLAD